jgi:hypothetical protein
MEHHELSQGNIRMGQGPQLRIRHRKVSTTRYHKETHPPPLEPQEKNTNAETSSDTGKPTHTVEGNSKISRGNSGQQTELERTVCSGTCKRTRLANTIWATGPNIPRNQRKIYMATIPLYRSTPYVICS